jgi:hypothetical protein
MRKQLMTLAAEPSPQRGHKLLVLPHPTGFASRGPSKSRSWLQSALLPFALKAAGSDPALADSKGRGSNMGQFLAEKNPATLRVFQWKSGLGTQLTGRKSK